MAINYARLFHRRHTPQSQPIPGSTQVPNSAGGYAWQVDDWTRLDRFLRAYQELAPLGTAELWALPAFLRLEALDDLLAVTHEFINSSASRSGLDRCLRRHGVANLKSLQPEVEGEAAPKKTFKDYEPGFLHVDIKYLPQMPDETQRRYLFVAIDRATRRARGDAVRAADYYRTIYAACHGRDGTAVITTVPLGRLASESPWEALHKILNGHPDEPMPALRVLGNERLVDVLAYLQTLPQDR